MKQQRLLGVDEILVERETCWCRDFRHECREAINTPGDFVDLRVHWGPEKSMPIRVSQMADPATGRCAGITSISVLSLNLPFRTAYMQLSPMSELRKTGPSRAPLGLDKFLTLIRHGDAILDGLECASPVRRKVQ